MSNMINKNNIFVRREDLHLSIFEFAELHHQLLKITILTITDIHQTKIAGRYIRQVRRTCISSLGW